ncbi:MAG: hypothetical protein ACT4PO_11840 [Actinomycetota bacterium]
MDLHAFLKRLPKVSLHVHLEGSVQAATVVDLANKHGVPLPEYEQPENLYDYPDIYQFLRMYDVVCHSVWDREDFHRITYETLRGGRARGAASRDVLEPLGPHGDRGSLRDRRGRRHPRHQRRRH